VEQLLDPDVDAYEWARASLEAAWPWAIAQAPGLLGGANGPLVALLAAGLALMWLGRRRAPDDEPREADEAQDMERPTNTPLWRRLWWRLYARPIDVMQVDGMEVDRTRKPHCLWLGPTGSGKTSGLVVTRCDGKRPMLAVTPDLSDPLIEACERLGGFHWTACVSTKPVDFLIGSPTEVAERLTEVFRSGGNGVWKRAARRATAGVIRTIDERHEQRSLQLIGERLRLVVAEDRELARACAGWVERFLDLADQFGDSIGAGGVDIGDLLNEGKMVLLDNDAFEHPALGGDVVALGLAEAKRVSNLIRGGVDRRRLGPLGWLVCLLTRGAAFVERGFRLVFEEAAQLGERIDLADPFFRAGRRRRIMVDGLTQAESDLDEAITSNSATRVYFAQELKSLQKAAAERLGLDYRQLDPSRMRDFTAWIAHGKVRRLVRFTKPPKGRAPVTAVSPGVKRPPQAESAPPAVGRSKENGAGGEPTELTDDVPEAFSGDEQLRNIYRYVEVKGSHRLSRYALNNRGRPLCKYQGDQWLPYALVLAIVEDRDLVEVRHRMADRSPSGLSVDHLCRELDPTCSIEDERRCQEITHLCWKTKGGNRRVQWQRKRQLQVVR
jgi:hypothetical protein